MNPTATPPTGGVTAIAAAFARAKAANRSALITYLTVGYPSPQATLDLALALARGGADLIELGVPFSDPIADGPVIQRASHAALQAGVTPRSCLDLVASLRASGFTTPLVLMGYYNPILRRGLGAYAEACAIAGVDGLIVPDLPVEESGPLHAACHRRSLALIQLAAPTTGDVRLARIAAETEGFLYLVSRLGITGAGETPHADLGARLAQVRALARTPIAVGFGIATPQQARALASEVCADGVIVGSAIVERAPQGPQVLEAYVASLATALRAA